MSAEVTTDRREWKKKHLLTPHNVGQKQEDYDVNEITYRSHLRDKLLFN